MSLLLYVIEIVAIIYIINLLYISAYLYIASQEKRKSFWAQSRPNGSQEYAGPLFRMWVDISGNTITIAWEFKEGIRNRGFYLLGFKKKKESPKHDNSFVTSYDNGQMVEAINDGCSNEYEFVLRREFFQLPPLDIFHGAAAFDNIAFSVELDSAEEQIRKIKKSIELKSAKEALANTEKQKIQMDPIDARIAQIEEELKCHLKSELVIDSIEKEFTDKINAGPYTRVEKKEKLGRLNAKILQLKNNL